MAPAGVLLSVLFVTASASVAADDESSWPLSLELDQCTVVVFAPDFEDAQAGTESLRSALSISMRRYRSASSLRSMGRNADASAPCSSAIAAVTNASATSSLGGGA